MATDVQKKFCKAVYNAALRINEISPVFVAAQACYESGWGVKVSGKNNYFGITRGSWPVSKCSLVFTTEYFSVPDKKFVTPERVAGVKLVSHARYRYSVYRLFKNFDSIEDCLREHLRLFQKPGYADAWPYRKDPIKFAARICDSKGCKYATDPNYASTMSRMIKSVQKIVGQK